jgi:hypothetical protein
MTSSPRQPRAVALGAALLGCSPTHPQPDATDHRIDLVQHRPPQPSSTPPPLTRPLLVPDDPDLSALLEPLIADGLRLGKIEIAHDTEELLAAVAPGRTIILYGEEYRVPKGGLGPLGTTSQLTLVGDTHTPRIVQTDLSDSVLTLDGVNDFALYNVDLVFAGKDGRWWDDDRKPSCCGTLLVRSSRRIRLRNVGLQSGGKSTLDLYDVDDFSMKGSEVYATEHFARMAASTNIEIADTSFIGRNDRKMRGFGLESTVLDIVRSRIEGAGSVLFTIDPKTSYTPALRRRSARSTTAAHTGPSAVRLQDSVLHAPRQGKLASRPERIHVSSTAVVDGRFSEMTGLDDGRACNCQRRHGPEGWTLATSCWPTLDACNREALAVQRGKPGILPASSLDTCKMVYGTDEGDESWSAFFEQGHEQSVRLGVCSTSKPTAPPPLAPPPTADDRRWQDLGTWDARVPQRLGTWSADIVEVTVPVESKAHVQRAVQEGRSITVHPDDELVPSELARHRAHVLTKKGLITLGPWSVATYEPRRDEGWVISHPDAGLIGVPLIALSRPPSHDPSLRTPSLAVSATANDPLVLGAQRALTIANHRSDTRVLEREIQSLDGRFPGGATRVVSVHWTTVGDMFSPHYRTSVLFTADADDRPVQWICTNCHAAWLDFVADLDGDGFEEIGWTDVLSWEKRTHHITHLSETSAETRRLSTAL